MMSRIKTAEDQAWIAKIGAVAIQHLTSIGNSADCHAGGLGSRPSPYPIFITGAWNFNLKTKFLN